jgi:hypothetical protein
MIDEYHVVPLFSFFMVMSCAEVCNLLCTPLLLDSGFTWWWLYKDTPSDKLIIMELIEKTFCFLHIHDWVQFAITIKQCQKSSYFTDTTAVMSLNFSHVSTLYGTRWRSSYTFWKRGHLLFRIKTLAPKLKVGFVFYPLLLYTYACETKKGPQQLTIQGTK